MEFPNSDSTESSESSVQEIVETVRLRDLVNVLRFRFKGGENGNNVDVSSLSNDQLLHGIEQKVLGRGSIGARELVDALDLMREIYESGGRGFSGVAEVKLAVLARVAKVFFGVELKK